MSLQVWLPLTGDLHNQGLAGNLEVINSNTTFDNDGKIGQCASFNGSSSRISINDINIGNIWSYGCWFYSTSTDRAWESIMLLSNNGSDADTQLGFYIHTTQTRMQSTANGQYNSGIPYSYANKWTHFFATFDGSTLITYINGIEVNRKSITASLLERTHLVIGARSSSTSGGQAGATAYFLGKVNDVRLYDHCCSVKEVKEIAKGLVLHYKLDNIIDNNIYDCSGYQNNGTIVGTLSVNNNTSHYSKSILFNGTDACIRVPYKECNPDGIFTLNLWFYKDALGSKNYETLFGGPSGFEMDTRSGASTTLSLYMTSTRGGNAFSPFSLSTWYMVTMVRNGTNEMYYINGELKKTIEAKSMPNGIYRIGAWASDTGQNYYGNISDFRIYATVLSDEDILDLYHTPFSIDNKGNSYAREVIEDTSLNITKTGQFHGNEMLDDDTFTTASITKTDKQLKVNTLYEY